MKATDIVWGTDGEDVPELPDEVEITDPDIEEDNVADYLSDMYGFCIESLCVERGEEDETV